MQIEHKSLPGIVTHTDDTGTIEAVVSVFSNVDSAEERVLPGFFAKSLGRKLPKGVWGHDWLQPIAKTIEARELMPGDALLPASLLALGGLYIKGQFNLETQRGREAYSDIKFGIVDEFSIGYQVTKDNYENGVRDLIEGQLFEWSPVLVGCNDATQLIGIKHGAPANGAPARDVTSSTKGQYLGAWAEAGASMAGLSALTDALMYNVVYPAFWDDETEGMTVEQVLAGVNAGFAEYHATALRLIGAMLTVDMAGDAAESMKAAHRDEIKALWCDPEITKSDVMPRAGLTLQKRFEIALAAVENCTESARAVKELRAKEGRAISAARRETLATSHEAMKTACETLQSLLDETDPSNSEKGQKADIAAVERAMADYAATMARFNRAAIPTAV